MARDPELGPPPETRLADPDLGPDFSTPCTCKNRRVISDFHLNTIFYLHRNRSKMALPGFDKNPILKNVKNLKPENAILAIPDFTKFCVCQNIPGIGVLHSNPYKYGLTPSNFVKKSTKNRRKIDEKMSFLDIKL